MRVKFYGKHLEKQIANNEIIIWNYSIYEIVIRKVIMVMVRVKQLYLMPDGCRDYSQDIELYFSLSIFQSMHFHMISVVHGHMH